MNLLSLKGCCYCGLHSFLSRICQNIPCYSRSFPKLTHFVMKATSVLFLFLLTSLSLGHEHICQPPVTVTVTAPASTVTVAALLATVTDEGHRSISTVYTTIFGTADPSPSATINHSPTAIGPSS